MKCKATVTFEYPLRAPDTHRTPVIEAGGVHTIAARAVRSARVALKPISWSSMVVLLERIEVPGEADSASPTSEESTDPPEQG